MSNVSHYHDLILIVYDWIIKMCLMSYKHYAFDSYSSYDHIRVGYAIVKGFFRSSSTKTTQKKYIYNRFINGIEATTWEIFQIIDDLIIVFFVGCFLFCAVIVKQRLNVFFFLGSTDFRFWVIFMKKALLLLLLLPQNEY